MECKTANEYLPWLLNRGLEPAEKAAVEAHLSTCEECGRELRRTREALQIFSAHLPPEALLDYALDRSDPVLGRERIERHLAGCGDCREELALVRESLEMRDAPLPAPAPAPLPARRPTYLRALAMAASLLAVVAAGGWFWSYQQLGFGESRAAQLEDELRRLRSEVPESGDEAAAFQARISALEEERRALAAWGEVLATDLEAGARRVAELERRLAAGSEPEINVAVVDLFPGDTVLRGGAEGSQPGAPVIGGGRTSTLILNSRLERREGLAVRLLGPDGSEIWRRGGLRRDASGIFSLSLPLDGLAAGRYTLELTDPAAGAAEPPEVYRLEIR